MPVLIVVLYVVAELAAVIWVGSAIGVLATLGLLILGSVLGGALLRREGRRTLQALRASQNSGTRRPPSSPTAPCSASVRSCCSYPALSATCSECC